MLSACPKPCCRTPNPPAQHARLDAAAASYASDLFGTMRVPMIWSQ